MSAYLNFPSPIPASSRGDSPASITSRNNLDLIRLLIGNGDGTRIITEDGIPLSVESFFQNVNRYGNTFKNRFFVLIDGPGFFDRPNEMLNVPVISNIQGIANTVNSNAEISLQSGQRLTDSASFRDSSNSLYSGYERLSVLCNSASFPKVDIKTKKLELIPSMQESVAQYRDFSANSTFTMKFYNSSSMFERNYFESWMNTVTNIKTGVSNYYDEYAKPFSISVLKLPKNSPGPSPITNLFGVKNVQVENGSAGSQLSGYIYGVKYMECYPISISSVDFAYEKDATLTETEVTFAYKYYLSPSNISFLNSNISNESSYRDYLNVLKNLINNKGKVSYDPQNNNTDRLASAINGTVNRVTNVVAAIQQIY